MTRSQKESGSYYTPEAVVWTLLKWAVRDEGDRLIDPACGDGRFIAGHRNAVGIERDVLAARTAIEQAPWALVHEGDFFAWASETTERFECAAGNPPFIRYQHFNGDGRARALELCARLGVEFSGLASSWAPFLAATTAVLKPGARMAFVVPAEIGHAPYAAPLLEHLTRSFGRVHIVAIRDKFFPTLSEDCWLLFADGFGNRTDHIRFTVQDRFEPCPSPPRRFERIAMSEWRDLWNRRLRPFLIHRDARELYQHVIASRDTRRLGDMASVGIGYVSGANEFFHLRPSDARRFEIPQELLHPSVRNGRSLTASRVTQATVDRWMRDDDQMLLLKLPKTSDLPRSVKRYLDTEPARIARGAYKCRVRDPWYSVPDVRVPDFFLTYMSGRDASLVRNDANCTCTNSVHAVRIHSKTDATKYLPSWQSPFVKLSCELEGHPLGGGMLKLEPREAAQIVLPSRIAVRRNEQSLLSESVYTMQQWRHYAS